MSKGLEALHRIANANNHFKYDTLELMDKDFQIVQQELLRLEAIDNEKPSEALEDLEQLAEMADKCWVSCDVHKWKNTIKQTLIKSQEQKKVLKEVKADLTIELNNKKNAIEMFKQERTLREEQEKVLKIINENNVDIGLLKKCKTLDEYQYYCPASTLVPQEFDLLKRYCE